MYFPISIVQWWYLLYLGTSQFQIPYGELARWPENDLDSDFTETWFAQRMLSLAQARVEWDDDDDDDQFNSLRIVTWKCKSNKLKVWNKKCLESDANICLIISRLSQGLTTSTH